MQLQDADILGGPFQLGGGCKWAGLLMIPQVEKNGLAGDESDYLFGLVVLDDLFL
jgi:hypothetical protein